MAIFTLSNQTDALENWMDEDGPCGQFVEGFGTVTVCVTSCHWSSAGMNWLFLVVGAQFRRSRVVLFSEVLTMADRVSFLPGTGFERPGVAPGRCMYTRGKLDGRAPIRRPLAPWSGGGRSSGASTNEVYSRTPH